MTTYYLSTKSGNDSNGGTSATQAWSSFSKLTGKLKAGDTVLLENGSVFTETLTISKINGTAEKAITFSNYGFGEDPILASTEGKGIHAQQSSYIILENLTIQNTASAGIYATAANNWIVRNLTFEDAGGKQNTGSIQWWNSSNVLIENNSVHDSLGDGIFMSGVKNVIVKDNEFIGATGSNADNVQISGQNAIISGNIMVQEAGTNSTKGNFVFQGSGLHIHDNYLEGGSFGIGMSAQNVLVENNVVKNHTKYSWSSDIQLTDETAGDNISNVTIRDNILSGSNRNITIDGAHSAPVMNISNLDISGNQTDNWTKAPLVINNAIVNGVYEDNTTNKAGNNVYATNSNLSNFISQDNIYIPENVAQKMADTGRTITIVASGSLMLGAAPILKLFVNGLEVGQASVTALKAVGEKQTVTFTIPSFNEGDKFAISYTNDKFNVKTGEDRNLYVHSVSMDGEGIKLKSADLTAKVMNMKDGSGLFFSSNATATFTSEDVPKSVLNKVFAVAESVMPKLADVLEGDNHVIFYGNENHSVGATSDQSIYGSSFKDVNAGIDDLHQLLSNNFG